MTSDDASRPARLVIEGCDALVRPGLLRHDVDLTIVGNRIDRIAPAGRAGAAEGDAQRLDGRGLLAIPGLVNAHTHSAENCLRGSGHCLPLEVWVTRMFGTAGPYSPEDHYVTALAGAVEMLESGTTAVLDHLWMTPPSTECADAALAAYRDVGIRARVAPLVADVDHTAELAAARGIDLTGALFTDLAGGPPAHEVQAQLEDLMRRWNAAEGGRLGVFAGPCGVHWCSEELLGRLAETARRHETGLTIHLLETRLQRDIAETHHGTGPLQALDRLGLLGPRTSLAHGVWLTPGDIELLVERGGVVVHNPSANFRLGSGVAPVPELLAAGVRVALGADGAASSDEQSIWTQLRLAALVHNDGDRDRWISGSQALQMASQGGAAALGLDSDLGTLDDGALADVVLVDRRGTGLAGAQDLEAALALSASGRDVVHVIVDGRLVVADRGCATVDVAEVRERLAEQAARRAPGQQEDAATLSAMDRMRRLRQAGRVAAGGARV
jgi:cytosine/adenosine deaminase-related metal-dependent hydrolase